MLGLLGWVARVARVARVGGRNEQFVPRDVAAWPMLCGGCGDVASALRDEATKLGELARRIDTGWKNRLKWGFDARLSEHRQIGVENRILKKLHLQLPPSNACASESNTLCMLSEANPGHDCTACRSSSCDAERGATQELRRQFQAADTDNSGEIDAQEAPVATGAQEPVALCRCSAKNGGGGRWEVISIVGFRV